MLKGKSAETLERIAREASALAADLRSKKPSYALAINAGVRDCSYNTVRWGRVSKYEGEAIIEMEDGSRWKAIGRGPTGNASWIDRDGYIEFIPLE